MRLLYDNKIKDAILTPSSENANYPASNLKDPRLSRHLRFTGDEDESLLVDSGSLLKANYAALAGHNFSTDAVIKIQGNNSDSWGDPAFEQVLEWDADIILGYFTEKEYPYWRFLLDDPNNGDGYIKLGLAYLGTYYQVEKSFQKDFIEEKQNTDRVSFSKSGQIYGQKGIIRRRYVLHFPYWNNTAKKAIENIMDMVGKRNSHFMIGDEDNLDNLPPLYCVIEGDVAYTHIHNYIYKGSITFLEVF